MEAGNLEGAVGWELLEETPAPDIVWTLGMMMNQILRGTKRI